MGGKLNCEEWVDIADWFSKAIMLSDNWCGGKQFVGCHSHIFDSEGNSPWSRRMYVQYVDEISIGSRALSFKRPLLSLSVNVRLCVCPQLWGQISRKRKELASKLLWGAYRKVVRGFRMVTSPMTSRDPMTSYSWRHVFVLYANFGAPYLEF